MTNGQKNLEVILSLLYYSVLYYSVE